LSADLYPATAIDTAMLGSMIALDYRNRSSTIFPLFTAPDVLCKLSFLAYWAIKHESHVQMLLTLRDRTGSKLAASLIPITAAAAVDLSLTHLFATYLANARGFSHSVEVEVFSPQPPRFTYPAVSLVYRSTDSVSAVHACSRAYNPGEVVQDYALSLPQAGFDVHFTEPNNNYLAFCGGHQESYDLDVVAIADGTHKAHARVSLPNRFRQLHVVSLNALLPDLWGKHNVAINVRHNLEDIYPRFYVGSYADGRPPSLTHTFFNTRQANLENPERMFVSNPSPQKFYDAALMVPLLFNADSETALISYGLNAALTTSVSVQLLDLHGKPLTSVKRLATDLFNENYQAIELSSATGRFPYNPPGIAFAKITFDSEQGGATPVRQKLGLNIAHTGHAARGTNICFAPNAISERIISKPFSRRWGPVGGPEGFLFLYSNTSLIKQANYHTRLKVDIYNINGEVLRREISVAANASLVFDASNDHELSAHLDGGPGQIMVDAENFSNDAFFLSMVGQSIGGDHAF